MGCYRAQARGDRYPFLSATQVEPAGGLEPREQGSSVRRVRLQVFLSHSRRTCTGAVIRQASTTSSASWFSSTRSR
jgi:hypothetical protein